MRRGAPFAFLLALGACSASDDVPAQIEDEPASAIASLDAPEAADVVVAMADDWSGSVNYFTGFDALDPSIQPGAIAPNAAFNARDEYWGLPRTPGYEDVLYTCASCHSLRLVMQQSKTAQGWSDMIDWMVDHQGMAAPTVEERTRLVEYLATNFAEQ
jgi:hypothetical protein